MRSARATRRALGGTIVVLATTFAIGAVADEAAVRELEQKCEAAREAKIRPLREAEIERCISEQNKDPDYCRRYWRDFGAAGRYPNGAFRPRLFDDLPECVAARAARKKWNMEGE